MQQKIEAPIFYYQCLWIYPLCMRSTSAHIIPKPFSQMNASKGLIGLINDSSEYQLEFKKGNIVQKSFVSL